MNLENEEHVEESKRVANIENIHKKIKGREVETPEEREQKR